MSDTSNREMASDTIPNQTKVEGVVGEVIEDASTQAAVTNLVAITGGESPTEAEHNALLGRVNLLTQVLRDLGAIPSS